MNNSYYQGDIIMFDTTRARIADFISPELAERRINALVAAYADPLTKIGNRRALEAEARGKVSLPCALLLPARG